VTKDSLPTKSYEVQKIVKKLIESQRPETYDPFDKDKRIARTTNLSALRSRGFRQAVVEAYKRKCSVCGLKINSPDSLTWEVEAAHIVPNRFKGRDDIWNGIALCHLHHWAFDVGWFTLTDDYRICVSSEVENLPSDFGRIGSYDFIRSLSRAGLVVCLPDREAIRPHPKAMSWHRQNIFHHC
jgi:putative restriction endonuclease